MTTDEITQLISRTGLGDRNAFTRLYNATSAKLFGVSLRLLNNRAEAEEALQEIYIKIWSNSSKFASTRYSPMSWLIAIARNHCIDKLRARKPVAEDIDEAFDLSDDKPNPEQEAINTSERRRIDGCLEELDGKHADSVRGAYLEGYSYEELATRHSVPINTMRTWLRRSLMKLRECLER